MSIKAIVNIILYRILRSPENMHLELCELLSKCGFNPKDGLCLEVKRELEIKRYCKIRNLPKFKYRVSLTTTGRSYITSLEQNYKLSNNQKIKAISNSLSYTSENILDVILENFYCTNRAESVALIKYMEEQKLIEASHTKDGIFAKLVFTTKEEPPGTISIPNIKQQSSSRNSRIDYKWLIGILISISILIVGILNYCSNQSKRDGDGIEKPIQENKALDDTNGTIGQSKTVLVNECLADTYHARLLETPGVDSNAFTLEIEFYDHVAPSKQILDLPPGRSKIIDCNEDFVIVSFACGGPCYADVFISSEGEKPNETYGYSNRMLLDSHILSYIEGEEFEKQRIRNLKSGEEITLNISRCVDAWGSPCLINSMYFSNNDTLLLEYRLPTDEKITYSVGVEDLLKI